MPKKKKLIDNNIRQQKDKRRNFFKIAAALADPDFTNLSIMHKEKIRKALVVI